MLAPHHEQILKSILDDIHSEPDTIVDMMADDDWDAVARLLRLSLEKLADFGLNTVFLALCCDLFSREYRWYQKEGADGVGIPELQRLLQTARQYASGLSSLGRLRTASVALNVKIQMRKQQFWEHPIALQRLLSLKVLFSPVEQSSPRLFMDLVRFEREQRWVVARLAYLCEIWPICGERTPWLIGEGNCPIEPPSVASLDVSWNIENR